MPIPDAKKITDAVGENVENLATLELRVGFIQNNRSFFPQRIVQSQVHGMLHVLSIEIACVCFCMSHARLNYVRISSGHTRNPN